MSDAWAICARAQWRSPPAKVRTPRVRRMHSTSIPQAGKSRNYQLFKLDRSATCGIAPEFRENKLGKSRRMLWTAAFCLSYLFLHYRTIYKEELRMAPNVEYCPGFPMPVFVPVPYIRDLKLMFPAKPLYGDHDLFRSLIR